MKVALITTTINVPQVLKLYVPPEVSRSQFRMFVAADKRTPRAAAEFCAKELGEVCQYLPPEAQQHWACSEPIGWNCVERRNLALLEAVAWGAETIVTVDDDNIPLLPGAHALAFARRLEGSFGGLRVAPSGCDWFDPGALLLPPAPARGLPTEVRAPAPAFEGVLDAPVGVCAGICLGDPDIDAYRRLAGQPPALAAAEPLRAGVAVDPQRMRTVFNSQNTAFRRALAPAMFMPPFVGRNADILASIVCQALMGLRGEHVVFGPPFVWQQRNPHSLVRDLSDEMFGLEYVVGLARVCNDVTAGAPASFGIVDVVREIWRAMLRTRWFPAASANAALAFCDDIERALGS